MKIPKTTGNAFLLGRTKRAARQPYPLRLAPELYQRIGVFAASRDRTVADVIREALREYMEKHDA